jgi:hypothetical protein
MKSTYFSFALGFFLLLIISACSIGSSRTNGRNDLVTEERKISDFSELSIEGVFNIYLSQGKEVSLRIEAEEEVLEKIISQNQGDKLIIELEEEFGIFDRSEINIYLTINELESLDYKGVGNIKTEQELQLNKLKIRGDGVGNTKLEIDADEIDAIFNLVGNVNLKGSTHTIDLTNNGVGNVDASDLKTQIMTLTSNGIGNVEVYSEKEISITVNGIGKVIYDGNAEVKELNRSGIGKVKRK